MNFNRPKIVVVFVILFVIVGSFWALLTSVGTWLIISGDPTWAPYGAGDIAATMFIIVGATISHFASALVLFSGKKPKKNVIILVTINVVTNIILILSIPELLPFFVPAIIFNLVFLIFLQKNKELVKYASGIYLSPNSQPGFKSQNITCSNCNTIADSSNKFCKKCGARISGGIK